MQGIEADQLSITVLANDVIMRMAFPLPDTDSEKISRFLAKCGIETLYFKEPQSAFEREFDTVRQYARYGSKNVFVPFLWGKQTDIDIQIYLSRVDSKKKGRFYFATTLLSVYFIQLNRVGEDYASKIIAEEHELKIFDKKCFIKRESPRIQASTTEKLTGK